MKARLTQPREGKDRMLPVGTVIEHPDAFMLVDMGVAEPADTECQTKSHELRSAREARHRMVADRRAAESFAVESPAGDGAVITLPE